LPYITSMQCRTISATSGATEAVALQSR
jgi:hypothetical protein